MKQDIDVKFGDFKKVESTDKPGSVMDNHSSGYMSPYISSNLPEYDAGRINVFLFDLAPDGVYLATHCYQLRGALLPHPFTLTLLLKLK